MTSNETDGRRLEAPLAEIERHLMGAYVAGAGRSLEELLHSTDPAARELLAAASRYASGKLSEVEARSRYVHELHGTE
jgi:hypothetical protein